MIDLTGKHIVLTGGGAGIGLGILRQCVAAGAKVTVFEVDASRAGVIADTGGEFVQVDIADPNAIRTAVAAIDGCNGLVNNAGITIQKPLADLDLSEMEQLWSVNQRAMLLLIQALTPKLAAAGDGAIVNVASNHARASAPGYEAYAGTKGAIVAMTRALAWSLGVHNIRVNALAPGLALTEKVREIAEREPDLIETFNSWHARGRFATVDEIGCVAAFLLSDAAAALTGSEVIADHGMSAKLGGLN